MACIVVFRQRGRTFSSLPGIRLAYISEESSITASKVGGAKAGEVICPALCQIKRLFGLEALYLFLFLLFPVQMSTRHVDRGLDF